MEKGRSVFSIDSCITQVRISSKNQKASFGNLYSVREELRLRRKNLIGSYISLEEIVGQGDAISEPLVEELSEYLAQRTVTLWPQQSAINVPLYKSFYSLAITAVASGKVGNESVDDIIQLAECLVRSRDIFTDVMRNLLPLDRIGELFRFVSAEESCFAVGFEDAVLGSVAIFLGALEDPITDTETDTSEGLGVRYDE